MWTDGHFLRAAGHRKLGGGICLTNPGGCQRAGGCVTLYLSSLELSWLLGCLGVGFVVVLGFVFFFNIFYSQLSSLISPWKKYHICSSSALSLWTGEKGEQSILTLTSPCRETPTAVNGSCWHAWRREFIPRLLRFFVYFFVNLFYLNCCCQTMQ